MSVQRSRTNSISSPHSSTTSPSRTPLSSIDCYLWSTKSQNAQAFDSMSAPNPNTPGVAYSYLTDRPNNNSRNYSFNSNRTMRLLSSRLNTRRPSTRAIVILMMTLTLPISSCRTTRSSAQPVCTNDSLHTARYQHDSIYLYERDSIFTARQADTIYVEKWKWRYRDRIQQVHDTTLVYRDCVRTLPPERYIPSFYRISTYILYALILGAILLLLLRLR